MITIIGLSVKDTINLLDEYGIKLISGVRGLSREIQSVSVLEISSYDKSWIKGKELILTTLSSFKTTKQIITMLEDFTELGVGAIGIHPGLREQIVINDKIIQKSNEIGFPILSLPRNIAYTTIFSEVLGKILNKQSILLKKSDQVNRYIMQAFLEGGGISCIADSLSNIIEKPVVILDELGKLLAKSFYNEEGEICLDIIGVNEYENILQLFNANTPHKEEYLRNIIIMNAKIANKEYYQIVKKASTIRGDDLGYIVIWENMDIDEYGRELDLLALMHANTALELIEIKRRAIIETKIKLNFDFFDDLLNKNFESEEVLIRRADFLGFSIKGKHQVIIVDIDNFERYYLDNYEKGEEHIQFIKNGLKRVVDFSLRETSGKNMIISKSDSIIVLLQVSEYINAKLLRQKLECITQYIQDKLKEKLPEITVSIGVGDTHPRILELSKSFDEAKKSIDIGKKIYGIGKTTFYSDLGIYNVVSISDFDEFKENCNKELKKIIEFGSQDNKVFLDTLEVFLDSGESLSVTAKKMFVHPNTVKYRVNKTIEVIGEGIFENSESKLLIHLYLKLRKLTY